MKHRLSDVGGTRGGLPLFLLGLGMTAGGAYFLLVKPKTPAPAAASLVLGPAYGGVRGTF